MKIAVFGANGNIGQAIVREALDRSHQVTAAIRYNFKMPRFSDALAIVPADVSNAASVTEAVRGHDAVISAIGGLGHDNPRISIDSAPAIIDGMTAAGVHRLIVVGTAGTLLGDDGVARMDRPGFPKFLAHESTSHRELQSYLATVDSNRIAWSYFAPPINIIPGKRTGKYLLGSDHLLTDAQGNSYISNEDYAVALIDELERPKHVGKRFTVRGV